MLDLKEVCPGLGLVGQVILPKDDYNVHLVKEHLSTGNSSRSVWSQQQPAEGGRFWGPAIGAPTDG